MSEEKAIAKECRFCGESGIHPNAHIIPKSGIASDGKPLILVNARELVPTKRSQTGLYDPDLWCLSCERKSAALDTYVASNLFQKIEALVPIFDRLGQVICHEAPAADATMLAKFVLSVLWRSSASQLPALSNFTLGPFEDVFRQALLNGDAEKLSLFPFLLALEKNPEVRGGAFTPYIVKIDNVKFACFSCGGFWFRVKVSSQSLPSICNLVAVGPGKKVIVAPYELLKTRMGGNIGRHIQRIDANFGSPVRKT